MSGRDAPRVLFYSHNGVGIGHVYRQLTLGQAFRQSHPGADVLVVTGSHAAGALPWPDGIEYLKLPSIRMVDRYHTWVPRNLSLSMRKVTELRARLIREAVRRFAPDLLVADFLPAGPYGELLPALEKLEELGGRAVAGFRDIIDEPAFVRELWHGNGTYDVIDRYYTAVLVYGSPDVVDFAGEYGAPSDRLHYAGYLAPLEEESGADEPGPFLLATTGGGVDGMDLLRRFVQAVEHADGRQLVVCGPLLSSREYKGLRTAAQSRGIEIKRTVANLGSLVQRADVVVTMAGYNTSCALLASRARAVIAPRAGPSQEQRLRADWLENCGVGEVVPHDASARDLGDAVERALAGSRDGGPPVPLDGIRHAVEFFAQVVAR